MTAALGTEEYAANLALGHIGRGEIALMSETGRRARAVRLHFPVARDAMLRRKWWNFATGWCQPAMDTVAGTGVYTKRFPLPADCLLVRYVKDAGDESWQVESGQASVGGVQVETQILVTNFDAPNVCYTRRIESPRLWDALFLDAFGHELAGRIATILGRSQSTAARHADKAADLVREAAPIDSRESSHQRQRPEPSILGARRGWRFSSYRGFR